MLQKMNQKMYLVRFLLFNILNLARTGLFFVEVHEGERFFKRRIVQLRYDKLLTKRRAQEKKKGQGHGTMAV